MKYGLLLVLGLSVGVLGASSSSTAPPLLPRRPVSFQQSFGLLERRNIFDSSRNGDVSERPRTTEILQPRRDLQTLTGLVLEDGAYSAFVEDGQSNVTTKYRVGDTTPGGKLTSAGMDSITLQAGGRTIHVWLGQNLSGMAPVATTNPTTEPIGPGGDMIERLRQRRLQELHQ
ncbi:MAG TPA: hypothetical protein VGG19_01280 [Tepidisphaeraceae bacterium]|jgi:hypothetical protein